MIYDDSYVFSVRLGLRWKEVRQYFENLFENYLKCNDDKNNQPVLNFPVANPSWLVDIAETYRRHIFASKSNKFFDSAHERHVFHVTLSTLETVHFCVTVNDDSSVSVYHLVQVEECMLFWDPIVSMPNLKVTQTLEMGSLPEAIKSVEKYHAGGREVTVDFIEKIAFSVKYDNVHQFYVAFNPYRNDDGVLSRRVSDVEPRIKVSSRLQYVQLMSEG